MIERCIDPRCGSGQLLNKAFFKGIVTGSGIDFTEVDLPGSLSYRLRRAIVVSDAEADDNTTKQNKKKGNKFRIPCG